MIAYILALILLPTLAWGFPSTPVLDTFTGVDNTSPPSANWTNSEITNGASAGGCDIEDNAVAPSATGGYYGCYWNAASFNADSEAYITIVNTGSTAFFGVCTRIANPGNNTTDGYCVDVADATSAVSIIRLDDAVASVLGSTITQTITTSDSFGITAVGDQICAWFSDNGGAWGQLGCRTDSTYTAGGRIALYINGNTGIGGMDDFGGGNYGRRRVSPLIY